MTPKSIKIYIYTQRGSKMVGQTFFGLKLKTTEGMGSITF